RTRLPQAALPPDALVELDAVAGLGGLPTLLSAEPADLAEELGPVPLLGREAALATGLRSGHLRRLGHPGPPRARGQVSSRHYPTPERANDGGAGGSVSP